MVALSMSYVYGTPLRPTSASNQQPAGLTRSQDELKEQLKEELRDAVFEPDKELPTRVGVEIILNAFYGAPDFDDSHVHVQPDRKDQLMAALRACRTKEERAAYQPLADLFNQILDGLPKGVAKFRFYVYDREMRQKVDGSGNQKPDLLALLLEITAGDRVLWRQVLVAVEVKGNIKDGTIQALTYTRSMLAMEDKWFAPALVYNHSTGKLRGVFATRFGVFMTPIMDLFLTNQFRLAARMVARMCSAVSTNGLPGLAGYDSNRCLDGDGKLCISLPTRGGAQWFRLHDLSHRNSLVGRATQVAVAQPIQEPTSPEAVGSASFDASEQLIEHVDGTQSATRSRVPVPRRSTRLVQSRRAEVASLNKIYTGMASDMWLTSSGAAIASNSLFSRVSGHPTAAGAAASSSVRGQAPSAPAQRWASILAQAANPASPLPVSSTEQFILKSSWQALPKPDNEGEAMESVQDLHGCPDYAGDFTVRHPLSAIADLARSGHLRMADLVDDTSTTKDFNSHFQPRSHKIVISKRPGVPFYHLVSKPKRLTHAVADVMIGLYATYKKGISHRDVTTGNLLGVETRLTSTEAIRKKTLEALGKRFTSEGLEGLLDELHAFVNDFEHAIDWKEAFRERSFARSGTPEFMSVQQLLVIVEARLRAHTVIDDLESCIWVALYNVLHAYIHRHSEAEKAFYQAFATDDYGHILGQKFRMLHLTKRDKENGSALSVTWALWSRLFPIACEAQAKVANLMAKYLQPEDQDEDERALQGSSPTASPSQVPADAEDKDFPPLEPDVGDKPSSAPIPKPGRDDPANPMYNRGWASAQEKRLDEYHAELGHLTEEVFYKYMHALKDAMKLLPESDEDPEIA